LLEPDLYAQLLDVAYVRARDNMGNASIGGLIRDIIADQLNRMKE